MTVYFYFAKVRIFTAGMTQYGLKEWGISICNSYKCLKFNVFDRSIVWNY